MAKLPKYARAVTFLLIELIIIILYGFTTEYSSKLALSTDTGS